MYFMCADEMAELHPKLLRNASHLRWELLKAFEPLEGQFDTLKARRWVWYLLASD